MADSKSSGEENVKIIPKVGYLDAMLMSEGPANLEVANTSVNYDLSSLSTNDFKDRVAFESSVFTEETKALEEMADLLTEGEKFKALLYTFRSCSKALPMVKGTEPDALKAEIHKQTFAILRPEIIKLKEFMDYHERAVACIRKNIQIMVKAEAAKAVVNEEMMMFLIRCIDLMILLDALKDMKACLLNDFSRYKRSFSPIRSELPDSDAISEEIHNLQMFLGNPSQPHNLIMFHLKTDIQKVSGHDSVLCAIAEHALLCIEQRRFMFPDEEHAMYRVIPYIMYILDSDDKKGGVSVFKHKKLNLAPIQKLYKIMPVIPLYADMQIEVAFVLRRCKHWEEETMLPLWQTARPDKLPRRYELKYHRNHIRAEYNFLTSEFAALMNEIRAFDKAKKIITPQMLERVFVTVVGALQKLAAWSAKIKEQSAWKYSRSVSDEEYKKIVGTEERKGKAYEQVVRYNYSPEELYALVDVIGMIKGLGGLMMKSEMLYLPLLRRHIHDEFQIFLQQEVARPLRKAHKRARKIKDVMLQMRDIGCDWMNRADQKDDYLQKKKILIQVNRDFPRRATAPTVTQITLIRRMMHTIFSPKAAGMQGGVFKDKDLKKEWIPVWDHFYDISFYFKYLLDYSNTIRSITDMSDLWYREFYLEMTHCVQFPIAMSMPWIMTEFLIKTPAMKENIFFPMDIYNDAAARAVNVLHQQFLYDEIEAELNLTFDQLIFHLSDDVFKYFKTVASTVMIDKNYEKNFAMMKRRALDVTNSRYVTLMAQRQIVILGRSVDVRALISQHVNSYLRKNLDYVIRSFESRDLSSIVALDYQLTNCKLTHALLSEHLNVDPWETMFKEMNEDTQVGQFRGKIVWHVAAELISDIIPNFVFNESTQRFVRPPIEFLGQPQRDRPPTGVKPYMWFGRGFKEVFDRRSNIFKGYFGIEHIESMLNILQETDLPLIIHELTTDIENKVIYDFAPYVQALSEVLPPMKLPQLHYGVVGGYGYYEMKLKTNIAGYAALRPEVFQLCREIGNTLLFIRLLETVMSKREDLRFQHSAFFLGIRPHPPPNPNMPAPTEAQAVPFILPEKGKPSPLLATVTKYCTVIGSNFEADRPMLVSQINSVKHATVLYDYVQENRTLMGAVLDRISKALIEHKLSEDWKGTTPPAGLIIDCEQPKDFPRLWSCLQFLACQPPAPPAQGSPIMDDMETFGDGFFWCGAMIIHLLGFRQKFEMLDFSYHVMKLEQLKPLPPDEKGKKKDKAQPGDEMIPIIRYFLYQAKWVKDMNSNIYACLESYFTPPTKPLFTINPPTDEELANLGDTKGPIMMKIQPSAASTAPPQSSPISPGPSSAPPSAPSAPAAPMAPSAPAAPMAPMAPPAPMAPSAPPMAPMAPMAPPAPMAPAPPSAPMAPMAPSPPMAPPSAPMAPMAPMAPPPPGPPAPPGPPRAPAPPPPP